MNIQNDIKSKWGEFTTGKMNAMKLMEEYIEKEHIHLPVEQIHNEYVKLKSDKERLKKEIIDKVKGEFILVDGHTTIGKDNKEIVTAPEYYKYTTKANLVSSITSELWNVSDVVTELQGKSWANYIKTI